MRSILAALQDGRLYELPAVDKTPALEFLARILDANPDIEVGTDMVEMIEKREQLCNTGIGGGVAIPHIRAKREDGDLFCAIGWSREGIAYGASDGQPVHLVVMYYIPGMQKNAYLKEVSSLVKAMRVSGGIQPIAHAEELSVVRNSLLDWVVDVSPGAGPESVARMIKIEGKQARAALVSAGARVTKFSVVVGPSPQAPSVLGHDLDFIYALEREADLGAQLGAHNGSPLRLGGRQVFVLGVTGYAGGKSLYECVALMDG